jgi:hypothetical protein
VGVSNNVEVFQTGALCLGVYAMLMGGKAIVVRLTGYKVKKG